MSSQNRARSVRFEFRCTPEEAQIINEKAAAAGMNRTEFLIKSLSEKEINIYPGITEMLTELKRQGINLNQAVRYAHHDQIRVAELAETIKNCNELYSKFLEIWKDNYK